MSEPISHPRRPSPAAEPQWLRPREAARHLGVDLSTLQAWRESAGLPHHRGGASGFLYEANSLDAWLAARQSAGRPRRMSRYPTPGGRGTEER
jgi:excisionase family DNA binding protein